MSAHTPVEVESVLAAIGVDNILRGEPTFKRGQFREARDLTKRMREEFDRFYETAKFDPPKDLPPFDYDDVLALVSQPGITPEQTEALATVMPDADMAMELGIEAGRVLAWANQTIPRNVRQSFTGDKIDPPDPESAAQFRTRWQVAVDPMTVVRDMLQGCLDADQVSTLALLYPALYQEMRQAEADARTAAAMEHGKDWDPGPSKAAQAQTLLQAQPYDAALAASVQQAYDAQNKPAPHPPRAPGSAKPVDTDMTPGQRAAAG